MTFLVGEDKLFKTVFDNQIAHRKGEVEEMGLLGMLFLKLSVLSPLRYTAEKCGHRTRRSGPVSAFGQTIETKMPLNEKGVPEWCLDCIGKMAVRCPWCERPIFIGEPITLFSPVRNDFRAPENAVVYREEPLTLVGCLGVGCADTGADRAGFWIPGEDGRGQVFRVPSPLEMIFASGGAGMVIVNDVGDIKEALNPRFIPDDE